MGENASLDDFGEGSTGASVDPIVPVLRWVPDGLTCPGCGTSVQELWMEDRSAGRCIECKDW